MSIRYSEDFKKEVVKAYMAGGLMNTGKNAFIPPFFNVTSFSSVEMMDELTMKYINWYNYVRPHSYNDYLTPMEARYR